MTPLSMGRASVDPTHDDEAVMDGAPGNGMRANWRFTIEIDEDK
jgi:hypothetical protein